MMVYGILKTKTLTYAFDFILLAVERDMIDVSPEITVFS